MSGMSAGFKRPVLHCEGCGEVFSVFSGQKKAPYSVELLPDPFPAICPLCSHQATYPKSSIHILVGVGAR